jgi:hypothetical protein
MAQVFAVRASFKCWSKIRRNVMWRRVPAASWMRRSVPLPEDVQNNGGGGVTNPTLPPKPIVVPWPAFAHAISVKIKCASLFPDFARHIAACRNKPPEDWGYKVFSQSGDDGYLAVLADRVGLGPRRFVEFGFAPVQNNLLAFAMYHRAAGLFMDGSARHCRIAGRMLRYLRGSDIKVRHAWITKDNVDALIAENIGAGEIDVLSIDVDGNDYWLWQAIVSVQPRIVVMEYNAGFGAERAVTVVYDAAFDRGKKQSPDTPHYEYVRKLYHGASLAALEKLGRAKGYSLICCEETGVNAFFVRSDLLGNSLTARTARDCFRPHRRRLNRGVTQAIQEEVLFSEPVVDV